MNYEEMSDFELNKAVSDIVDFGEMIVKANQSEGTVYLCEKDGLFSEIPIGYFDPCNNPTQSWSLMVENKISLITFDDEWEAHHLNDYGFESNNIVQAKAGRAVSICFLKMKDAENDI